MKTPSPSSKKPDTGADDVDYDLLPDLVGYHLRRAQLADFAGFGPIVDEFGVTPGQFGVLTLIDANPGLTQSALAKAVGIERSTMVAVIDALERRGLVERRPSPVDRRSYALVLSPGGRTVLVGLKEAMRRHDAATMAGFTDAEKRTLIALLRRIWEPS